ncbi:SDR family oxidoreductase [Candidatus Roizmanbacteria bacterium]|nr:SDR family oxidoreductase [Candidatus Roizmanbacteria bacterium]
MSYTKLTFFYFFTAPCRNKKYIIGIGRATVERFAQEPNYTIYATGLHEQQLNEAFPEDQYPQVIPFKLDVADFLRNWDIIDYIFTEHGGLDVLINNAGIMRLGPLRRFWSTDDGKRQSYNLFVVNCFGPTLLMAATLSHMRERGSGTIINILSSSYFQPHWPGLQYAESKRLFMRIAQNYYREEKRAQSGVRIVSIQPGRVNNTTIDDDSWIEGTPPLAREAAQAILDPVRRRVGMEPETIAQVLYDVAEGQRKENYIIVGNDAKLSTALSYIPGWPLLFQFGFAALTEMVKAKLLLQRKLRKNNHE